MLITIIIIASLIFVFLLLMLITYLFHNKLFGSRFKEDEDVVITKDFFNLSYEEVTFPHKNVMLKGYLYQKNLKYEDKIIIFAHGMWSCHNTYIQEIAYLANAGFLVLGFDYYGVNLSEGKNIKGFGNSLSSLNSAVEYVKNDPKFKGKDIYVAGHSWGGFATINVVKYQPEIKGIVAMSPFVTVGRILKPVLKGALKIFIPFYVLVDALLCGKYSFANGIKSLKGYKGKIFLIQSTDDNICLYKDSVGLIKETLKDKDIKYLILNNRRHNPPYTDEAMVLMNEFFKGLNTLKGEELKEFKRNFNYEKLAEIDPQVYDKVVDFINE